MGGVGLVRPGPDSTAPRRAIIQAVRVGGAW